MNRIDRYENIISIITKGYALLFLLVFAIRRLLLSTISTMTFSLADYPKNSSGINGIFPILFHPMILIVFVVGMGILSIRNKVYLSDIIYPAIVLVLFYSSNYLF